MKNSPKDWPPPLGESKTYSVDVLAYCRKTGKHFIAYFSFADMLWYADGKKIASKGFKWREFDKKDIY